MAVGSGKDTGTVPAPHLQGLDLEGRVYLTCRERVQEV